MKIEDNFLDQEKFDELQTFIVSDSFAWFYVDGIDYSIRESNGVLSFPNKGDKNKFQFYHMFVSNGGPTSSFCDNLEPVFEKIDPMSFWRIKANLLTRTPNIVENEFHVDMDFMSKKQQNQWTTSIFYINTNNGYTKFEDGTKVESVANRMITFPADMKHTGASCTDEKIRVVINFNYFK